MRVRLDLILFLPSPAIENGRGGGMGEILCIDLHGGDVVLPSTLIVEERLLWAFFRRQISFNLHADVPKRMFICFNMFSIYSNPSGDVPDTKVNDCALELFYIDRG